MFGSTRKVLITGGSGFLGKHIAKMLLEKKYSVTNLINSTSSSELTEYDAYSEFCYNELDKNIDADIIIHCATNYGRDNSQYEKIFQPNLYLPLQLLIKRMHHDHPLFFINIDTSLEATTSLYALSKNLFLTSAEKIINEHQLKNIKFINIKLEHFYGFNAPSNNFITYLTQSMQAGAPNIDLTLGEQQRDFIYIQDAVNAISMIINEMKNFDDGVTKFEIGSGENITIKDAVLTIADLISYDRKNLNFGAVPYRKNEQMMSEVSLSKIKHLGWLPEYSFAEGIKEMLKK